MIEDLGFIAEPDPVMIESFYRITDRYRTAWDAETLLALTIARQSMSHRATDKDCEQPYKPELTEQEAEDKNSNVVSSFFSRFKGK